MNNQYKYIVIQDQSVFHRYCEGCSNWIRVSFWKGSFPQQGNTCGECRLNKKNRKPIGVKLRFRVFNRDNFTCRYCGESAPKVKLHVDHIKPISKGGNNSFNNLITACQDCNLGKSNSILIKSIKCHTTTQKILTEQKNLISMI